MLRKENLSYVVVTPTIYSAQKGPFQHKPFCDPPVFHHQGRGSVPLYWATMQENSPPRLCPYSFITHLLHCLPKIKPITTTLQTLEIRHSFGLISTSKQLHFNCGCLSQVGQGLEHSGIMEGVTAHGRGWNR